MSIHDILLQLYRAILDKQNKQIQKHVFELFVSPRNFHTIISEITLYCVNHCKDDIVKCKIVETATKYIEKSKYMTNSLYVLVTFCYNLTTILTSENTILDKP